MPTRGSLAIRLLALIACFLLAALLCAPFGAANYFSLLAGHNCTCDETPLGDAKAFAAVLSPLATVCSLVLGAPVCWIVSRRLSPRLAALAAGATLGAVPYAGIALLGIMGLADSGYPVWMVILLSCLVGAVIGGGAWFVLSLGGRWRGARNNEPTVAAAFD
jgi:hypothetical protein